MKQKKYPVSRLIARLSHFSMRFILKCYAVVHSLLSGFWLGIMGEKSLDAVDDLAYARKKLYSDEIYNTSGLFEWEKTMIEKYFKDIRDLLLIAAGAGREVIELSKRGFELDSYECNPGLVKSGNALLEKKGISVRIKLLPRDQVPSDIREYEGIIIGWGAYSHMRGSKRRKSFIMQLKPFLKEKAPLMISFVTRKGNTIHDNIIYFVSNFFRFFKGKRRTERGDRMDYQFFHYFSEDEIVSELQTCGYKVVEYYSQEYGCVVARKER
jgi:hypothetical protein